MTKNSGLIFAFAMAFFSILYSCNSGSEKTQDITVDTSSVNTGSDTSNITHEDSTQAKPVKPSDDGGEPTSTTTLDTIEAKKPEAIKTAKLGYSYYPRMKRGDTKIIRAFVSINNPESKIRDTLRLIEKMQTVEAIEDDTSNINIINSIPFYKTIKIEIDTTSDFIVKAIRPARQQIDTLKGNLWLWQITAKTDKRIAGITILVDAENPAGVLENIDIRQIKINIEIDKVTFVRAAINYMGDNPAVSIPIIVALVSFIGWLIKYYLEKRKTGNA